MSQNAINFFLVGVGGQGTILASNILAELGMSVGYDVKKAEVHGMSQRGGSVTSHVRWDKKVFSPILSHGDAEILLAFEKLEAIRFIHFLKPGGICLINNYTITPLSVHTSDQNYPTQKSIHNAISRLTERIYWVDGLNIAENIGNVKTANVVLLGALSSFLDIDQEHWIKIIEKYVPKKAIDLNIRAFHAGRATLPPRM